MQKYSILVRWMLGFFFALVNSVLSQSAVFQFQAYMYTEDALRRPFEGNILVLCQIYDRSSDGDGKYCWRDSFPNVPVERGIFEVAIGSRKPLDLNDLRQCDDFPDSLFLDITAIIPGQQPEHFKPRRRLGAAIMTLFAQEAQVADSLRRISISDSVKAFALLRLNADGKFPREAIPPVPSVIEDSSITDQHIKENAAVDARKINFEVEDFTIPEIAIPLITQKMLANSAVDSSKIGDGAISSAKIQDSTIVDSDISADAHINHSKIDFKDFDFAPYLGDSSITEGKLAGGAVSSEKIKDGAVSGMKIQDSTITDIDIAGIKAKKIDFMGFMIPEEAVPRITQNMLASDAVDSSKIRNGTIIDEDINKNARIKASKIDFTQFNVPNADTIGGYSVSNEQTPQPHTLFPLDASARLPVKVMPKALDSLLTLGQFSKKLYLAKDSLVVQKGIRTQSGIQTAQSISTRENIEVGGTITFQKNSNYHVGIAVNSPDAAAVEIKNVGAGIIIGNTEQNTVYAESKNGASFNIPKGAITFNYALEATSPKNAFRVAGRSRFNGSAHVTDSLIVDKVILYQGKKLVAVAQAEQVANDFQNERSNYLQIAGTARLANGKAYVGFDATFGQLVVPDSPIIILLTAHGFAAGELRVMSRSPQGFDVELQPVQGWEAHSKDVDFDWIAMATPRR